MDECCLHAGLLPAWKHGRAQLAARRQMHCPDNPCDQPSSACLH